MSIDHKRSQAALDKIRRFRTKCFVIHYSSQSLYDDREGHSPRIANIVIRHLEREQTISFAAHLIAERIGVPKDKVEERYDEIEEHLLTSFYEFVRNEKGSIWLHWNMKNMVFGFDLLAHRYYVLTGGNAPNIDLDDRINIASMLQGLFGSDYVKDPKIPNLMKANGGIWRDFISGADEVEAFREGEFSKLHASTLAKVTFFGWVVDRVLDRKLKFDKVPILIKLDRHLDHPLAEVIGLVASIYTIIDLAGKAIAATPSAASAHIERPGRPDRAPGSARPDRRSGTGPRRR